MFLPSSKAAATWPTVRDKPDPPHGSRGGREPAGGSAKARDPQTQSKPRLWCSCCFSVTGLSPAAGGEPSLGESQRGPVDVLGEPGWSPEAALASGNQGETMGRSENPSPCQWNLRQMGRGLPLVMKTWGLGAGAQGHSGDPETELISAQRPVHSPSFLPLTPCCWRIWGCGVGSIQEASTLASGGYPSCMRCEGLRTRSCHTSRLQVCPG